ncbi:hypothetical protein M3Y97_00731300 [Aphelenchoides bicaudatus]|nr:hypothetical protein M3Y97_00731300 [Aphelenchoides bicaudatus]
MRTLIVFLLIESWLISLSTSEKVIVGLSPNSSCESLAVDVFNLNKETFAMFKAVTVDEVVKRNKDNAKYHKSLNALKALSGDIGGIRRLLVVGTDMLGEEELRGVYVESLKGYPAELSKNAPTPENASMSLFRKHQIACYEELTDEEIKKLFGINDSTRQNQSSLLFFALLFLFVVAFK